MPPKPAGKSIKKSAPTSGGDDSDAPKSKGRPKGADGKKRRKKGKESYAIYIYKV